MDKRELMRIIYVAEAALVLMALAAYIVVRNLSVLSAVLKFAAWLVFLVYVIEAVTSLIKVPRKWAGLVGLLLIITVFIGLASTVYSLLQGVAPLVVQAVQRLVNEWPDIMEWVQRWTRANPWLGSVLTSVLVEAQSWFTVDNVTNVMLRVMVFLRNSGGNMLLILGSLILAALITPYKDRAIVRLEKKIPKAMLGEFDRIMNQYAIQRIVSAVSLAVILFLGNLLILRDPVVALGLASLAFVLDFVPYLGPFVAFVINGAVVLVMGFGWARLLFSLVMFIIGQGAEQLVAASLASIQFSIPLLLALLIVLLGGSVAGVPGLILGVPVSVYLIKLVRSWSHDSGH